MLGRMSGASWGVIYITLPTLSWLKLRFITVENCKGWWEMSLWVQTQRPFAQEGIVTSLVNSLCYRICIRIITALLSSRIHSQSQFLGISRERPSKALMIPSLVMFKASSLNRPIHHTFWTVHSTPQTFGRY